MAGHQRSCARCGKRMPVGSRKTTCSEACKRAMSRRKAKAKASAETLAVPTPARTIPEAPSVVQDAPSTAPQAPAAVGATLANTLQLLERHDRMNTPDGAAAVLLARRLDAATVLEPGSGLAALQKSHANAMDRALHGVDQSEADVLDGLKATAAATIMAACGVPDEQVAAIFRHVVV